MDHLENSTTSTPDPALRAEPIPSNAEPIDTQPTHTAPPPNKRKPLSTEALENRQIAERSKKDRPQCKQHTTL